MSPIDKPKGPSDLHEAQDVQKDLEKPLTEPEDLTGGQTIIAFDDECDDYQPKFNFHLVFKVPQPPTTSPEPPISPAAAEASSAQWNTAFKDFPQTEQWRMFIDRKRQLGGANADTFDQDEPGYRAGMEQAFSHIQSTLGRRLYVSELIRLHDLCVAGVRAGGRLLQRSMEGGAFIYGLASGHVGNRSTVSADNNDRNPPPVTADARAEWESENLVGPMTHVNPASVDPNSHYLGIWNSARCCIGSNLAGTRAEQETVLQHHIQKYYDSISSATTENEKLLATVRLCRALEIAHVFPDGNQRTIVFVLLNKLLIENKLSPVILDDPYIFDGYLSATELVEEVKRGAENFASHKVSTGAD
ncbi:MAG: hypothetical protein JKY15_02360 [Deltaproteobacteria bacterium]|nr:hypothetical protein [Deltaproteobacteria bacterium]